MSHEHTPRVEQIGTLICPHHPIWHAVGLPNQRDRPDETPKFGRALAGRDLKPPPITHVMRPEPVAMSRLLNLHKAATDLAEAAPDILVHPEVAKAIEQALARAMVGRNGYAEVEVARPGAHRAAEGILSNRR